MLGILFKPLNSHAMHLSYRDCFWSSRSVHWNASTLARDMGVAHPSHHSFPSDQMSMSTDGFGYGVMDGPRNWHSIIIIIISARTLLRLNAVNCKPIGYSLRPSGCVQNARWVESWPFAIWPIIMVSREIGLSMILRTCNLRRLSGGSSIASLQRRSLSTWRTIVIQNISLPWNRVVI